MQQPDFVRFAVGAVRNAAVSSVLRSPASQHTYCCNVLGLNEPLFVTILSIRRHILSRHSVIGLLQVSIIALSPASSHNSYRILQAASSSVDCKTRAHAAAALHNLGEL